MYSGLKTTFFEAALLMALFPLLAMPQPAEARPPAWTSAVDWEKGELTVRLEIPAARSGFNAPASSFTAEKAIENALPGVFRQAAAKLLADSVSYVEDLLLADTELSYRLLETGKLGRKSLPEVSDDLGKLSVNYVYPLHETLGFALKTHSRPSETPRSINWEPTAEFSGIVIYAKEPLPVHGERRSASLVPCLFPEIFDEAMNPVLLTDMADPAYLKRWGSAAYTSGTDEKTFEERIGKTPLRIIARGLYGVHPTDVKIHPQDAAKLLSSSKNRRLLAEGRILIIADLGTR